MLLFAAIGLPVLLLSQEAIDQQPQLRLSFERQNNFTYNGFLDLSYKKQFGKYRLDLKISHEQLLNSSRKDQPFVQFLIRTHIWQYYDVTPKLGGASLIETDQFLNNQNQRFSAYVGPSYRPNKQIEITPLFGYSWDYRRDQLDEGFSPAFRLRARHLWKDGTSMQTYLFLRYKDLEPRRQHNIVFRSFWDRSFGEFANLQFGLQGGSNEFDDYRLNSVERIISDTISPFFNLRYQLGKGLYWDSENQYGFTRRSFVYEPLPGKEVEFNSTAFNQTEFYSQQKLSLNKGKFSGFASYGYQFILRRYQLENDKGDTDLIFDRQLERERQKDYTRNLHSFELYLSWRANKLHRFILSGSNHYLQYDTPSEDNFDDHDELTYGAGLEWQAQWSRKFYTSYKLSNNTRQYAFLYKERSQDNYTQHALRLEFNFRWQALKRLMLIGKQYIYVTYNVKDFSDLNLTDRSTRNLETQIEAIYRPTNKWRSSLKVYRKETHVSYIKWETFTETTLDTNLIYMLEWKNEIRLKSPWKKSRLFADLGYKHFGQSRFQNTSMTSLENVLVPINLRIRNLQTGPTSGIRLMMKAPASIEFVVWWQYQIQDYRYREVENFTTLSSNYRESELLKVNTFLRPFFSFRASLWLGR